MPGHESAGRARRVAGDPHGADEGVRHVKLKMYVDSVLAELLEIHT
jgi:hypothetical protein